MNREQLNRSWRVTRNHLAAARDRIPNATPASDEGYSLANYNEWLSHNELELAFDELEGLGDEHEFGHQFWSSLLAAAENMKLEDHANRCRIKLSRSRPA